MLDLKYFISIASSPKALGPLPAVALAALVAVCVPAPTLLAADVEQSAAVTSTVLADRRTGRLVRRVVVGEKVIAARVITPVVLRPGDPPVSVNAPGNIAEIVEQAASTHGVDPLLVHAVIHVESAYNRFAVSPKGAQGLMQLIPETARRMGVSNSFDVQDNIGGGVKYLRQLQDRFGDLRLVLAAYNAGEEAVSRYNGIPPYLETREYVYKVGKRYGELRRKQPRRMEPRQTAAVRPPPPLESEHRPLEATVDSEGRLNLRTR
ncbi:MAG: lytic transglycosylase domain-containing protein [Bryobacteraceae bacterium]